jgi:PmbA protein
MDDAQIERWAAMLSAQGHEWELYAADGTAATIEVRGGEVETFKSSRSQGVGIRIRRDGRIGFSFATSLADEAVSNAIAKAVAAAEATEPNEFAAFAPAGGALTPLDLSGAGPAGGTEARVEAALRIERAAMAADPRVKRVRKATYAESTGREWLWNVHGLRRSEQGTWFSASVLAIAEALGESQTGSEFAFGRSYAALDLDHVGREAGRRAASLLGGKGLPTGPRTIVFENGAVADLLGVLAGSFLAESVQRNRSLLAGKLGEAVSAPTVTLVDDGLDVRGSAAGSYDGEGVPRQTTPLISRGVLTGYLYDIETAARDHTRSTGNAGRGGFRGPPGPSTSNLRLEPGSGSLDELCAEAGEGFLVTDLLGVHTANAVSGDFSLGATGFAIRNGRVAEPVRGVAVADNLLALLRRLSRVGGDFRYFGSIGTPSVIVPGVSVSGG